MDAIATIIGERIRFYRKIKKWSQLKLAEQAGFHYTYIGSIERGEKSPTINTVFCICKALNLPMEILFENIIVNQSFPTNYPGIPHKFYHLLKYLSKKERDKLYHLFNDIIEYKKSD